MEIIKYSNNYGKRLQVNPEMGLGLRTEYNIAYLQHLFHRGQCYRSQTYKVYCCIGEG